MENEKEVTENNDGSKCKNQLDFENGFRFYEKEIEARNLQYQNYNTWANYYALFTGALFVGYYTTLSKCDGPSLFSLLIVLVGLATSICWNLTVKGHYHWMLSYIKVLHNYEKELAAILKERKLKDWRAYSIFLEPKEDSSHANISSQKMTARFTLIISIVWCVLSVMELQEVIFEIWENFHSTQCFGYVCSFVISALIVVVVYLIFGKIMNHTSDVKIGENMTDKLYTGWTEKRWDEV